MNHSLIGADRATHLKIVTLAIVASILVGFAAHAGHFAADSSDIASTLSKPANSHSFARVEHSTVCRINAL